MITAYICDNFWDILWLHIELWQFLKQKYRYNKEKLYTECYARSLFCIKAFIILHVVNFFLELFEPVYGPANFSLVQSWTYGKGHNGEVYRIELTSPYNLTGMHTSRKLNDNIFSYFYCTYGHIYCK